MKFVIPEIQKTKLDEMMDHLNQIQNHIETILNNKNSFSQMLPPVLEYNKDKNFLEEINSDNNTVIYHNKSLTNDDSFEGNITIVSKPEIIKLEDSNSNMELNNNYLQNG